MKKEISSKYNRVCNIKGLIETYLAWNKGKWNTAKGIEDFIKSWILKKETNPFKYNEVRSCMKICYIYHSEEKMLDLHYLLEKIWNKLDIFLIFISI